MINTTFFKPTSKYKEFMILDLIEKNKDVTQREISEELGVAVSTVNSYLVDYESKGYIRRNYKSTKTIEYYVTPKGLEHSRLLYMNYLHNTQCLYNSAKQNIKLFIYSLQLKGFISLVIYGTGEVADLILNMMYTEKFLKSFNVILVDDSVEKISKDLYNIPICSLSILDKIEFDAILIGSYTYREKMMKKLLKKGINKNKIISFFN